MERIESVISLVKSLTKAEKKHVNLRIVQGHENKDYVVVYRIISSSAKPDACHVKMEFIQACPGSSFPVAVKHLYSRMLDVLSELGKGKDRTHDLLSDIMKARMLYERSLYAESLELLADVSEKAKESGDLEIQLIAQKTDLGYRYQLNFSMISEQELFHKHFIINDLLSRTREISEHSTLLNLLKYRMMHTGNIRTEEQKASLNDLAIRESGAILASSRTNFELMRNHLMFQASYLMGTGQYEDALDAYKKLNDLFENNPRSKLNPPIYYLSMLEGALDSLRSMGDYANMGYFLSRLEKIIQNTSQEFRLNATCLMFQYRLFPFIDRGDFQKGADIMEEYRDILYSRYSELSPLRKSELILYTAIVHIGRQEYKEARAWIKNANIDHNIRYTPVMKTIRLIELIIYYELGEKDILQYEARSIKRKFSSHNENAFKTEKLIISFVNRTEIPVKQKDREEYMKSIAPKIADIRRDKYEHQLLYLFDFISWIKSKILHIPLSQAINLE